MRGVPRSGGDIPDSPPGCGRGVSPPSGAIPASGTGSERASARISRQASAAAADTGMSASLRSVGLLEVVSTTSAEPSVARLASTPVSTASRRTLARNAGSVASVAEGNPPRARVLPPQVSPLRLVRSCVGREGGCDFVPDGSAVQRLRVKEHEYEDRKGAQSPGDGEPGGEPEP